MTRNSPTDPAKPCGKALDKVDFALAAHRISVGVNQIEPLLSDLLDFIHAHPECEPVLVEKFVALIDELPGGAETVLGYCLHELRWESVRDYLRSRGTSPRDREHAPYQRMLESFSDSWPQRVLYLRYDPTRDD